MSDPARRDGPGPGGAPVDPPADLGGHRILGRLGAGGMGAVYLAEAPGGGRRLALKVLRPDLLAGAREFLVRFRRESAVMAAVRHPNVVELAGSGEDRGWCWLSMEYLPDGDLEAYLQRRGQLMERDAVAMAVKCAAGLAAIHGAGLVHRDFKPGNVFLDLHAGSEPTAKVGDLGLARHVDGDDRMTRTGTACGTPAFMAPEQIRGLTDLDARVDVYALGATLYRLVTGQDPFSGKSIYVVSQAALKEPMPDPRRLNPAVSPALVGILLKAMAKDREERFVDMDAMRRDLERLLDGRSLTHAAAVPSPASLIFNEVAGQVAPRPILRPASTAGGWWSGIGWGPLLRLAIPAALGCGALWLLSGMLGGTAPGRAASTAPVGPAASRPGGAAVDRDVYGDRLRLAAAGRELVLRWCPPGMLRLGSDSGSQAEAPRVVRLATGCWMLDREVDRGLWSAVLGEGPVADPALPVGDCSRGDAEGFCQRLSQLVPGLGARLPTEAEWERACRAGSESEVGAGSGDWICRQPDLLAVWPVGWSAEPPIAVEDAWRWRCEDERLRPRPVAAGRPNPWGLYDLLGNQQEWCQDAWDGQSPGEAESTDPLGQVGALGVLRGGSWLHPLRGCRSGARGALPPHEGRPWTGFRFVVPASSLAPGRDGLPD